MTDTAIKKQISEQIEALERTTRNAIKSRKSANLYLRNLGLINKKAGEQNPVKKVK